MHASPFEKVQALPLPKYGIPPWLFDDAAGGIQISGDSGCGKSTLMASLMALLARQDMGFVLLDPHGDLARKMRDICLDMGPSIVRRLYYICASDASQITPLHPLGIAVDGLDPITWRARLTVKVAHVARILLHAWGERDFNSKPLMFKWVTRFLRSLGLLGLPLADIRHFFDVHSPLFQPLVAAVPDMMARSEMLELAELRPSEREEFIASTKNRFLGLLENSIVESTLSRVEGAIDLRSHIANQSIILVDLSPQGNLRSEDQEILANIWLNELLHAVYNTPEQERVPYFCFIDELPVFASCAPQICDASRQIRKMKCRLVAAHQGTAFFPEKKDDQLLNAMVGQFGTHFYFRHGNPVDARFFGEIVGLPSYSPTREKHRLVQPQQYQDGFDVVVLEDVSETTSTTDTNGGSQTTGTNSQTNRSEHTTQASSDSRGRSWDEDYLREVFSTARQTSLGFQNGSGSSVGQNHAEGVNWSRGTTNGTGRTRKQTLVPRLAWRDFINSLTFFSPDEHFLEAASFIAKLVTGQAFFQSAAKGVALVKIPMIEDPFLHTPNYGQRKQEEFALDLHARPEYVVPALLEAERRKILDAYVQALAQLPMDRDGPIPLYIPGSPAGQNNVLNDGDPDSPIMI